MRGREVDAASGGVRGSPELGRKEPGQGRRRAWQSIPWRTPARKRSTSPVAKSPCSLSSMFSDRCDFSGTGTTLAFAPALTLSPPPCRRSPMRLSPIAHALVADRLAAVVAQLGQRRNHALANSALGPATKVHDLQATFRRQPLALGNCRSADGEAANRQRRRRRTSPRNPHISCPLLDQLPGNQ